MHINNTTAVARARHAPQSSSIQRLPSNPIKHLLFIYYEAS